MVQETVAEELQVKPCGPALNRVEDTLHGWDVKCWAEMQKTAHMDPLWK